MGDNNFPQDLTLLCPLKILNVLVLDVSVFENKIILFGICSRFVLIFAKIEVQDNEGYRY